MNIHEIIFREKKIAVQKFGDDVERIYFPSGTIIVDESYRAKGYSGYYYTSKHLARELKISNPNIELLG